MTAPKFAYPGGWFGESWGAPVNEESPPRATPVGASCADCFEAIRSGDQGMLIPSDIGVLPWHLDCFLRNVLGPARGVRT